MCECSVAKEKRHLRTKCVKKQTFTRTYYGLFQIKILFNISFICFRYEDMNVEC